MDSSLSYITVIVIFLKLLKISSGKSKRVKFPNLWLIPTLFIMMIYQDCSKVSYWTLFGILMFGAFLIFGLFIGLFRGKALKYYRDENDKEIYYQESYQSLIIYVLIIALKWLIRQFGVGQIATLISLAMIFFACGSMVGRYLYISIKYLSLKQNHQPI